MSPLHRLTTARLRRRRHGLGVFELLTALSISAALLTATGVAIDASFKAYRINQQQSDLAQRSRLAIYRITTMIRQTKEHAPDNATLSSQFATGKTVTDTAIDMFDLHGKAVTYKHDPAKRQLLAIYDGQSHVMCEGVEAFTVRLEPMRSAKSIKTGGSWDLLRRATLLLTVKTSDKTTLDTEAGGQQTITLSASVMPRRNAW
jgi:hypothetical protein